MAICDSTLQAPTTGEEAPSPAEEAYDLLGVRLDMAEAVLQLLIADSRGSDEGVRDSCLFAVQSLLESADDAYNRLGEAMMATYRERRQPAAQE